MITLRDLVESDRDRLLTWRNLPEVRRWMYTDHVIERDEHDAWFDSVIVDPSRRYWVICIDQVPVGTINVVDACAGSCNSEFGMYVAEPEARGSGVGMAALFLAFECAFGELGIEFLNSEAIATNDAALGLYERIGMRRLAAVPREPRAIEVVCFGISRDEWFEIRSNVKRELIKRGLLS